MAAPGVQRVCPLCHGLTPASVSACARCGHSFRSEMRWEVPLIVLLFVAAFLLSAWLRSL